MRTDEMDKKKNKWKEETGRKLLFTEKYNTKIKDVKSNCLECLRHKKRKCWDAVDKLLTSLSQVVHVVTAKFCIYSESI